MARILVVEDSATERQIITHTLKAQGYTTIEAVDGEDGEAMARQMVPDAIVLDVVMPKKNGFQVCRTLNRDPITKHIPIILLTSKDQDSDKFWGMKQGASHYLTKPFSEDELIATLRRVLS